MWEGEALIRDEGGHSRRKPEEIMPVVEISECGHWVDGPLGRVLAMQM